MTDRTKAAREAKLKRIWAEKAAKRAEAAEAARLERIEETRRQEERSKAEQSRIERSRPLSKREKCQAHGLAYFRKTSQQICTCEENK